MRGEGEVARDLRKKKARHHNKQSDDHESRSHGMLHFT
jgi:hypothetical protein